MLNHIEKLQILKQDSTQIIAVCPVCGGRNLKIYKKGSRAGAYKCWSGDCRTSEIKEKLGINTKSPFKQSNLTASPFKRTKTLIYQELPKPDRCELILNQNYQTPLTRNGSYRGSTAKITEYKYSYTQQVERIDYTDLSDSTKAKVLFSRFKKDPSSSEWIWNRGDTFWPAYGELFVPTNCQSGNSLIYVEGEKVCDFVNSLGFLTFTQAGHSWDETHIDSVFTRIKRKIKTLEHVFIHRDNDEPGERKALMIANSASRNDLSYEIVHPKWKGVKEGDDLFDMYEFLGKEKVINYIKNHATT